MNRASSLASDDPVPTPKADRVVKVNGPLPTQEPGDPFCLHRWHRHALFTTRAFCADCGQERAIISNLLGP